MTHLIIKIVFLTICIFAGSFDYNVCAQERRTVPLPSSFSFLNKYIVDIPNGEKLGLYFIDTDKDMSNYEMFEYIRVDSKGEVRKRGILKKINFRNSEEYGKILVLNGIGLSKTDSEDYAPYYPFRDQLKNDDLYDFLLRITYENTNNSAISSIPNGHIYTSGNDYTDDLHRYKIALGIIK